MFKLLYGLLILFSSSAQLFNHVSGLIKCPLGKVQIRELSSLGFATKSTYDSTCQLALIYAEREFESYKEIENEACIASRGEPVWGEIQYKPAQGQCSLVRYPDNPGYSTHDHEMTQEGICCRNKIYQNEPIIDLHWFSDPEVFCKFHFRGSTEVIFSNIISGSHTDITCPNAIRGAIEKLNQESERQERNCVNLGGSYKLVKIHITPACSSFGSITSNDKRVHNVAFATALCCKGCKVKNNNTNDYGGTVPESDDDLELDTEANDFEKFNPEDVNNGNNTEYQTVPIIDVDQLFEEAKNKYNIDNSINNNTSDLSNGVITNINIKWLNYLLLVILFIFNH